MAATRTHLVSDHNSKTGPEQPHNEHFRKVQELFDKALDVPANERATFLAAHSDEPAVRREAAELLQADETPMWTASDATPTWFGEATLPAGTTIATFTIVAPIGEGGMGSVYQATQDRPQRTVALKTLRAGYDTPKARRRFEYESEILGRLQHPGIAQIYEAGTHAMHGRKVPFLAMELLPDACDLDTHIEQGKASHTESLRLFADVCDAVQHAHQYGIVHRDLKPSNLLVDSSGRVKVIDFGIALAMDPDAVRRTLRTETGVLLGTIAYMSPEQLAVDPIGSHTAPPDARTDVYSLGTVLFQLLTGRLPHDVDTLPIPTAMTVITQQDVPRIASYGLRNGDTPARELDWIVQKATEHDVAQRYQTVAELGADVRRFLSDRPLEVGPPSTTYRMRKFVHRHRAAVAGAALALLALLGGTIATAIGWHRAVAAEQATAQKRAELEQVTLGFWQTTQLTERISQIKSGGISQEVLTDLDRIAAQLDGQAIERPSIEAALRVKLAKTFAELGVQAAADEQYARTLALLDKDPRSMPEVRMQALTELGTRQVTAGKLDAGIARLEQAIALAEKHGSLLADPAARPRSRIAYAHHQQGRFADARDTYDDVLKELENQAVPYPTLRFQALRGRGTARRALGDRDGALADIRTALQHAEQTLGTRDSRTLSARVDLAVILLADRERAPEAEALLRDVAEARSATLGPAHGQTIAAVLNLAFALHRQKKFADSEELCLRYLAAAQEAERTTTVPLMKLRFNLGVAQMERTPKRVAAAEATFRSLVADAKKQLPNDHWMRMAFHARVGMCRLEAAEDIGTRPPQRPTLLAEARDQLELALRGLETKLGTKNRQTTEAASALHTAYEKLGQQAAADALRERFPK